MIKHIIVFTAVIFSCFCNAAGAAKASDVFDSIPARAAGGIDRIIFAELESNGIERADLCSDAVFLRRAYVEITGAIPTWQQILSFLNDKSPTKRGELIDQLLDSQGFIDYTTMYWCNVLRIKSEFPINLWPNAVQAYRRSVYDAVAGNMPYDEFVRGLLCSSGSNFRVGEVNFYRAMQGKTPSDIAAAVSLTFMGLRLENQDSLWQENIEKFFSRVAYKSTGEWKEEIIYCDPTAREPIEAIFPGGGKVVIDADTDPREVFCDHLITPENRWFNRCIVNRVWARLFGRGIIEPADDIDRDISPAHERLIKYLEGELVKNDYDLKAVYRLILNSHTWQLSPIPKGTYSREDFPFAAFGVHRLDAEVLCDALCYLSGTEHTFSSMVPEPYTFIPAHHSAVQLADGSITGQFLEMFGRPSRDSGKLSERNSMPSDSQLLHMLNSTDIHKQVATSPLLSKIVRETKNNDQMIGRIYLLVLSRHPAGEELEKAKEYISTSKRNRKKSAEDIMWALVNTKEFLYRH
jgi:hypothetical protein